MVPSGSCPAVSDALRNHEVMTVTALVVAVERFTIFAVTCDDQDIGDLLGIVFLRSAKAEDGGLESVRAVNGLGFADRRVVWPFWEVRFPTPGRING